MSVLVLLATHDARKDWLVEQLESIKAQRAVEVNLFVSDDFSATDAEQKAFEVLVKAHAPDSCVVMFQSRSLGVAGAFEEAITQGLQAFPQSEWIAFCDQDDRWLPGKLAQLIETAQATGASLVHCNAELMDESGRLTGQSLWEFEHRALDKSQVGDLLVRNIVTGCTALLRREIALKMIPFPKSVKFHDHWAALNAVAFGGGIVADVRIGIHYRQHASNVVGAQPSPSILRRPWRRANAQAIAAFSQSKQLFDALVARGFKSTAELDQKFGVARVPRLFSWLRSSIHEAIAGDMDRSIAHASRAWGGLFSEDSK